MPHALLVDDDPELRSLVAGYLRSYGMQVTAVADGAALRATLPSAHFDVLLLGLMLPDANGLDLCRWVRASSGLPVIMLTAQGDPASRIIGLELGADDYLPKPFEPRELVARINAVLRRAGAGRPPPSATQEPADAVRRFSGWSFDRLRHTLVSPERVVVALSNAEFRLLSAFVDHPRRVLSRERLLELSRASGVEVTDRSIDLAVSRLRQKLCDAPREGSKQGSKEKGLIRTVRGEGYLFDVEMG
jgi:two-component system, OmpR family, response regulator